MTHRGSETAFVDSLIEKFTPSPGRRNAPHESDAELIEISGFGNGEQPRLLAVTTDTISEEICTGLYGDPYQAGWMVVTANLSDLAATGAEPLGVLISETLPEQFDTRAIGRLQDGIADACSSAGTYVLGGDTNFGSVLSLTGTAIGLTDGGRPLNRLGCEPGDHLFVSGNLGRGNGYALSVLGKGLHDHIPDGYRPEARIREGRLLPGLASSCMDTSDGFFSTLDQLADLNSVGFSLTAGWENHLDRDSRGLLESRGLPPWLLMAGCHGEFELVFTVPPAMRNPLLIKASSIGWKPVEIGRITGRPGVRLPVDGIVHDVDVSAIRNLSFRREGGVDEYIESLLSYEWSSGPSGKSIVELQSGKGE